MKTYKNKLFEFATGWHGISFGYTPCAYYNDRIISLSLGWGIIFIHLGDSGKEHDVNDTTDYGFYYTEGYLVLQLGKKHIYINMPWRYEWVRTSFLKIDGKWENETKEVRKLKGTFYSTKENCKDLYQSEFKYSYILNNGEIQNTIATVTVEEIEWRPYWFMFTSVFSKKRKSIDVIFADPIGEGVGSWKGGITGCGYDMQPGERPYNTLKRMQEERRFGR